MFGDRLLKACGLALLAASASARAINGLTGSFRVENEKRDLLQDIVTYDNSSFFVRGERIMFYSGEFHPYRLQVPSLWLDIFQKIKALGYNGVSFYTDWALLEGKPGEFYAPDGSIFDLKPFFDAASEAGIYLLARPGPYINAEVSGGGFPGWLSRTQGRPRTPDPGYLEATDNYARNIGEIIAKAQITNGGPVILFQPENEYSGAAAGVTFPDATYMDYVKKQFRDAGIVVPYVINDNAPHGYTFNGTLYGFDSYPVGFACDDPTTWPAGGLPTGWLSAKAKYAPNSPLAIPEFQGGAFQPWGGNGFDTCLGLVNYEFERVFYKNTLSFGATLFSNYMIYGGTNAGSIGHPGGYTSYDYAAMIAEDRTVSREKYSQAKLLSNFVQASRAYLTAVPQPITSPQGLFTGDSSLYVTYSIDNATHFYWLRHSDYTSFDTTQYSINVTTSQGAVTVPQLGGKLTLSGRDFKIHVTDYDLGGTNLLYSSAEVFTWKKTSDKTVLVLHGGPNETHEFAIQCGGASPSVVEGSAVKTEIRGDATIVQFDTSPGRRILKFNDDLYVYLVDRNTAYNFWTADLPSGLISSGDPNQGIRDAAIIYGGYLVRAAAVDGTSFTMTADINATTTFEIISGAPKGLTSLTINGQETAFNQTDSGVVSATVAFSDPTIDLPDLSSVTWKSIDSLPEIQSSYDDSAWTEATLKYSNNTARNLSTAVSLYGQDYGFSYGNLIYRAHFTATGSETTFNVTTQGGLAYGSSLWIGSNFLGSFTGYGSAPWQVQTLALPTLTKGQKYIITVLIDTMGLDENYSVGGSDAKNPRGIVDYALSGHAATDITWKLTGNLGGESYADKTRGPLNEGGLFIERQGYHLPGAPTSNWTTTSSPSSGISAPGVHFYSTTFDLDIPDAYDVPLSISLQNTTAINNATGKVPAYRVQLYVNGWQYGKYVNNIGPQKVFPVPPGIWNYHGSNTLGVTLWALEQGGAKIEGLEIVKGMVSQSGFGKIENAPSNDWVKREGAY